MDLEAVSRTAAQLNEMGAASACLGLDFSLRYAMATCIKLLESSGPRPVASVRRDLWKPQFPQILPAIPITSRARVLCRTRSLWLTELVSDASSKHTLDGLGLDVLHQDCD